jgi:hypothetical protein
MDTVRLAILMAIRLIINTNGTTKGDDNGNQSNVRIKEENSIGYSKTD